jgi:hypothetical protein
VGAGWVSVSCDCKYMCFGTNLPSSLASGNWQGPVTVTLSALSFFLFWSFFLGANGTRKR